MANSPNERPPRSSPPSPEEAERAAARYRPSWEVAEDDPSFTASSGAPVPGVPIIAVEKAEATTSSPDTAARDKSGAQDPESGVASSKADRGLGTAQLGVGIFEKAEATTSSPDTAARDKSGAQDPESGMASSKADRGLRTTQLGVGIFDVETSTRQGTEKGHQAGPTAASRPSQAPPHNRTLVGVPVPPPTLAVQELGTPEARLKSARTIADLSMPSVVVEPPRAYPGVAGSPRNPSEMEQAETIPIRTPRGMGTAAASDEETDASLSIPRRSNRPLVAAILIGTLAVAVLLMLTLGGSTRTAIETADEVLAPAPDQAREQASSITERSEAVIAPKQAAPTPRAKASAAERAQRPSSVAGRSLRRPSGTDRKLGAPTRVQPQKQGRVAAPIPKPIAPKATSAPKAEVPQKPSPPPKPVASPEPSSPSKSNSVIIRESPF